MFVSWGPSSNVRSSSGPPLSGFGESTAAGAAAYDVIVVHDAVRHARFARVLLAERRYSERAHATHDERRDEEAHDRPQANTYARRGNLRGA